MNLFSPAICNYPSLPTFNAQPRTRNRTAMVNPPWKLTSLTKTLDKRKINRRVVERVKSPSLRRFTLLSLGAMFPASVSKAPAPREGKNCQRCKRQVKQSPF